MSKRVLTVDDSRTMREMVALTLGSVGFETVEAEDGEKALYLLRDAPKVDLVITDLNMPNMNGFELIERLRAGSEYQFTPILVLTTESDADKKERGKAAGATGWIVKPFSPEKLVKVVSKLCGISE